MNLRKTLSAGLGRPRLMHARAFRSRALAPARSPPRSCRTAIQVPTARTASEISTRTAATIAYLAEIPPAGR